MKRDIKSYEHGDKQRVNNPPVGLVTSGNDPDTGKKRQYSYDPHLDPQLVWAGKAEHISFEVPTVSLHVHERIDPRTIIEAVRKPNGKDELVQSYFSFESKEPLSEAIEFYKHAHGWSNRLIAGDSLLVMNSLLEKEGMAGKVQMIYIDPPYGIKYGSNFQPFVNKRDVKDGKDDDLTSEPEQIRAFRDTWELGIHSYLTYLRDRLLLARELLSESGSVFVQISDENVHHVRELMDEVFGAGNFISIITFSTTSGFQTSTLSRAGDYLCWYGIDKHKIKYNQLFKEKMQGIEGTSGYDYIEMADGTERSLTIDEKKRNYKIPIGARLFAKGDLQSQGSASVVQPFQYKGRIYLPNASSHWKPSFPDGINKICYAGRISVMGNTLRYKRYENDFSVFPITNLWHEQLSEQNKQYVVQTSEKVITRCVIMTTDPGDLVLDPTCGSGTTAYVAEQWGRRWITCDTSRVALALARQRLMTAVYDFYELARPHEGVGSGFRYKTVPHITLKSIANNPDIQEGMTREQIDAAIARHAPQETLYDQPFVDKKKKRVSGPFTVEAVPAPMVKSLDDLLKPANQPNAADSPDGAVSADASIARKGETLRQTEWKDELQRTGIRGKGGQYIRFARLEALSGCRWLHAIGMTQPETDTDLKPEHIVVSFGPEHAPMEKKQVSWAIKEAQSLVPSPTIIVFAAFQFDPEAAKDIRDTKWLGVTLLEAIMNPDLLTDDLKKKRASNDSFWLVGQPDVLLEKIKEGDHAGKYKVSVLGFDYYNTKNGAIESGGHGNIAIWLLDTDYDGRSLFPRQVFFPMSDTSSGWIKLAKSLKAEIDPELIESYCGTVSLPFVPGDNGYIAVKIVDDRGIESMKIIEVK